LFHIIGFFIAYPGDFVKKGVDLSTPQPKTPTERKVFQGIFDYIIFADIMQA